VSIYEIRPFRHPYLSLSCLLLIPLWSLLADSSWPGCGP
jgi:hypothetical protein